MSKITDIQTNLREIARQYAAKPNAKTAADFSAKRAELDLEIIRAGQKSYDEAMEIVNGWRVKLEEIETQAAAIASRRAELEARLAEIDATRKEIKNQVNGLQSQNFGLSIQRDRVVAACQESGIDLDDPQTWQSMAQEARQRAVRKLATAASIDALIEGDS